MKSANWRNFFTEKIVEGDHSPNIFYLLLLNAYDAIESNSIDCDLFDTKYEHQYLLLNSEYDEFLEKLLDIFEQFEDYSACQMVFELRNILETNKLK